MAAALECLDAGLQVHLLEARPRLGGATFSFCRDGLTLDNGQHVFLRCCTEYRSFLRRIGGEADTVLQDRLTIPVLTEDGRRARLRRARLPAPLHLVPALAAYRLLSPADKARAARAALALRRLSPDAAGLDEQSFGAWLAARAQTCDAVRFLWDLITVPALNIPARDASLALAVKVFRTGLLEGAAAGDIGYARIPLSELHAAKAERALYEAGARIDKNNRVRAIRPDGGRFVVEAEGGDVEAGGVIVAVPHDKVTGLLPPGSLPEGTRPGDLGGTPIVNVHVLLDRKVMDEPFAAAPGSVAQWVFDRSEASGIAGGQLLSVSVSAADQIAGLRRHDIASLVTPALQRLFPPARKARIEKVLVTRERKATFRQAPGSGRLRPGPVTRVPGLKLAGAWTNTGWPATMEGAVRSGRAAARSLLAEPERARIDEEVPA
jgi:squalene-associated FAD-dependent desaturase